MTASWSMARCSTFEVGAVRPLRRGGVLGITVSFSQIGMISELFRLMFLVKTRLRRVVRQAFSRRPEGGAQCTVDPEEASGVLSFATFNANNKLLKMAAATGTGQAFPINRYFAASERGLPQISTPSSQSSGNPCARSASKGVGRRAINFPLGVSCTTIKLISERF